MRRLIGSEGLQDLERLADVLLGLELVVVDVLHDALLVQHVRLAPRQRPEQVRGDAPLLAHAVPLVAQQRERQPVLLRERLVRRRVVAADADHLRPGLLELLVRVPERARLLCASGRLVGGVEVNHDGLALELVQRHGLAVLVLEGEVRRHAALGDLAADYARGRRRAAPARGRRGGCGRPEAAEHGGGGRAEERRLRAGRRAAGRRPRCQRQGSLAAGRSGRECHGGWSFRSSLCCCSRL